MITLLELEKKINDSVSQNIRAEQDKLIDECRKIGLDISHSDLSNYNYFHVGSCYVRLSFNTLIDEKRLIYSRNYGSWKALTSIDQLMQ
jgi:hypothetical protein